MSKKKINTSGIVFSTNPDFNFQEIPEDDPETLLASQQKLRIRLETKHRAGKTVTLIMGFIGKQADKEELIKKLKNHCGTGGSSKDGEMLVQGDQREKVLQWLKKNGYADTKIFS
ncbi:MAG: translation initiation factor [Ferruginibacter sp.]|nr:translation initiation factor [Ferruginibacter sp.]